MAKTKIAELQEIIRDLRCENAKLNLILFHKENHLAHPDTDITIGLLESKLADAEQDIQNLLKGQCHPACEAKLNELKLAARPACAATAGVEAE